MIRYCVQFDDFPLAALAFSVQQDKLCGIEFIPVEQVCANDREHLPDIIRNPINAYFKQGKPIVGLPTVAIGSFFQRKVWYFMRDIPIGETRTYGEVAKQIGGCAKAVGNVCRQNPFPLLNPCHRIIAKTGIGGFAGANNGWQIRVKYWLLMHENQKIMKY